MCRRWRPKPCWTNAKENLAYFDKELAINRARFKAGDIARVDLDRIALQRVQYESDFQTALVNARTAKITLLMLLNDRTPVDQFDVTGPFEFQEQIQPLDDLHTMALAARPDLQAALLAVEKAGTDHRLAVANGSTDPDFLDGFRTQSADPRLHGGEHQHPPAAFRPQPGREGADPDRYRARPTAERRGPGAGVQRRGFGVLYLQSAP